jgi:hypothetical protein
MSERAGNAGGQRTVEVSNLLFPEDSMGTFASSLQGLRGHLGLTVVGYPNSLRARSRSSCVSTPKPGASSVMCTAMR